VTTAKDGAEAVAAVAGKMPDLILMDVSMPVLDGIEATRQIRAMGGAAAEVPIIALTAHAFASDVESCHAAGMNDHLAKPIETRALFAALARHAPPHRRIDAGFRSA
jgi:CheY-like chemotaxis protein